jgi:hypothetical protein
VTTIGLPNPCLLDTLHWSTMRFTPEQDWNTMSFPVLSTLLLQDIVYAEPLAYPMPLVAIMRMATLSQLPVESRSCAQGGVGATSVSQVGDRRAIR